MISLGSEQDPAKRIRQAQGTRIKEARKYRNLSHAELAVAVGVSPGAVSQWETGRTAPRQHHQAAIAKALDVPWSQLFSLDRVA